MKKWGLRGNFYTDVETESGCRGPELQSLHVWGLWALQVAQMCTAMCMCAAPIDRVLHSKLCADSKLCVAAEGIISKWGSERCEPRFALKETVAILSLLWSLPHQMLSTPTSKVAYESNLYFKIRNCSICHSQLYIVIYLSLNFKIL